MVLVTAEPFLEVFGGTIMEAKASGISMVRHRCLGLKRGYPGFLPPEHFHPVVVRLVEFFPDFSSSERRCSLHRA